MSCISCAGPGMTPEPIYYFEWLDFRHYRLHEQSILWISHDNSSSHCFERLMELVDTKGQLLCKGKNKSNRSIIPPLIQPFP